MCVGVCERVVVTDHGCCGVVVHTGANRTLRTFPNWCVWVCIVGLCTVGA